MELLSLMAEVAELGRGAFATVYLYKSRDSKGDYFAVKKIKQARVVAAGGIERVFCERDALTKCTISAFHASLRGVAKDQTYLYFITECAQGGDLNKHIEKAGSGGFNETRARFYAASALGIRHIHSQGVVHRDLKANNVALTSSGHVKIFDFGLAKVICSKDATEKLTLSLRTRTRLGTAHRRSRDRSWRAPWDCRRLVGIWSSSVRNGIRISAFPVCVRCGQL